LSDVTTDDAHFTRTSSIIPPHTYTPQQKSLFDVGMKVRKAMADSYTLSTEQYSYHKSGAAIRDAYYNTPSSQDESCGITSSQESNLSTSTTDGDDQPRNLKRLYEDEDEADVDQQSNQQMAHSVDSITQVISCQKRPQSCPRRGKRSVRRFHIAVERSLDGGNGEDIDAVEQAMDDFEESHWLNDS